jgi:hypothetical protein
MVQRNDVVPPIEALLAELTETTVAIRHCRTAADALLTHCQQVERAIGDASASATEVDRPAGPTTRRSVAETGSRGPGGSA